MRFLCVYKPSKAEGAPPTETEMAEMGKLIEDMTREGVLLATEGCMPSALGARVRMNGDEFKVTDGPFAEAKELIGGLALINVKSKEEAIAQTKRFLKIAGDGECEIRQLCEVPALQLA
ncbi:YciI family protein [Edaphobacter sp.]|uniref:YciI family protein n=1 Tax=Edaphobacter sp. TaxID=1934404 RepID=UPI002DBD4449|nr:YciI family protein [Edaphobacter sp.]HEU5341598.1 YciI family protein [Edaphobacter sp.]